MTADTPFLLAYRPFRLNRCTKSLVLARRPSATLAMKRQLSESRNILPAKIRCLDPEPQQYAMQISAEISRLLKVAYAQATLDNAQSPGSPHAPAVAVIGMPKLRKKPDCPRYDLGGGWVELHVKKLPPLTGKKPAASLHRVSTPRF